MKIAKKISAVSTGIVLLSSLVMPLASADNSGTNTITGYGSSNYSTVTNTNKVNVDNVSDTRIVNTVSTISNSGGNSASYNTLGGMVSSGNATSTVGIANTGNVNTTTLKLGTSGGNTTGNSITGALSTNTSDVTNKNDVSVRNDNTAVVDNWVTAGSTTGNNAADYNTGAGHVLSGNATTGVQVTNHLDDSATKLTLGMGGSGENLATNNTTGALSGNFATIKNLNDVDVRNVSDARVLNSVNATSDTGSNTGNYNTLGGVVSSGNAGVGVGLDTTANINTNTIAVAMGGFENVAGSSITGAESTNVSDLTNKNDFEVVNRNNKGSSEDAPDYCRKDYNVEDLLLRPELRDCWGVFNYDTDQSITGSNSGDFNTGLSSVLSGVAGIQKTVRTWINDSFTAIEP